MFSLSLREPTSCSLVAWGGRAAPVGRGCMRVGGVVSLECIIDVHISYLLSPNNVCMLLCRVALRAALCHELGILES